MAAPVLESVVDSMDCARRDGKMVISYDALRRPRKRCPKCDGVAKPRPVHPDQVLRPVSLASLTVAALPPIQPGQLRCQRCAKGVDGNARFHPACARARAAEQRQRPCPDCHVPFIPSRGAIARCASCKAKRKAPKTRLCTGCNRITPRKRGPKVVSSCWECRPAVGTPRPRVHAPKKQVRLCSCGRPMPKRPGRPRRACDLCLGLSPEIAA